MRRDLFANRIIWLTGASSGIGEALAHAFANAGAKLILSARRVEELKCVRAALPQLEHIHILALDLGDAASLPAAAEKAWGLFGSIDIMVHNGGISQRSLAVETLLEVDRHIMEVNFFGTVALTKALIPHFRSQGRGQFVVISSVVGKIGSPYRSGYAASKHALHGFFDALRAELTSDNISVTLVLPGFVHTNISVNALDGTGTPTGRMDLATQAGLKPEDVARGILSATFRKRNEIAITGTKEGFGLLLKRFAPGLLTRILPRVKVR